MEAKDIFVNNISCTEAYLMKYDRQIGLFMIKHWGCDLKLIHSDEDLDKLWELGFENRDIDWRYTDDELDWTDPRNPVPKVTK